MKRLFSVALLLGLCATQTRAQQPQPVLPDCIINFNFTTGGNTNPFNNVFIGCDTWTLTYSSVGLTALTLTFQSAPGPVTPGTFITYPGTVSVGINPNTNTSGAAATFSNLSSSPPVSTPWVRMLLSGVSGTGQITGVLYGYRTGYSNGNGGGGGSGCAGTASTPCIVAGPTASGSPPTKPPILVAGFDGTNLDSLSTDTSGHPQVVGTSAAGSVPVGAPVEVGGTDGTDVRLIKTDGTGNQAIFQIGLSTFTSGQQAVTGTAAALATNTAKSVCVKALIANTINVYVGATGVTTSTGFELTPGGGACFTVANTNLVFVVASTTGASVAWSLTN
jgi:hypothetical protein